jgi:hypothetical protein
VIARLRACHARVFAALAIVAPLGLWAALDARQSPARSDSAFPTPLSPGPEGDAWTELARASFGDGAPFRALRRSLAGLDSIGLRVNAELRSPELLAYACASEPEGGELPSAAWLLGPVGTSPEAPLANWPVPPALSGRRTWLVLFSLGHAEIVGVQALDP